LKIGIITDIHEDAERLTYAMKSLEKLNCDMIVCLGDISGFDERFYSYQYSKNLKYCLDVIKVNCRVIIPGNHDMFHLNLLPRYNSVFHFPENWYNLTFAERKKISKGMIWLNEKDYPVSDLDYFRNVFEEIKESYIFEESGDRILFTHSISPDISGFLTKKPSKFSDFKSHLDLLKEYNCNIGISGHLHPNGLLRIDSRKIHKPKFTTLELPSDEPIQYIAPCIADGVQDNGYTVFDTVERTIESFPLRTPRHNSFLL
jgi:predicted phosphodiesterase